MRPLSRPTRVIAIVALALAAGAAVVVVAQAWPSDAGDQRRTGGAPVTPRPMELPDRPERRAPPRIQWRDSVAVGLPEAGRLERGVRLPPEGRTYFTWDPIKKRAPNRGWRRWGTDELVRTTLGVLRDFRRKFPAAPRIGVGDLSRPHGGDFGAEVSGGIGHATHQNGLDVDLYYPRLDRAERAPTSVDQVDVRLSQALVDLFVEAGATVIYTGPSLPLTGPAEIVQPLVDHDNHVHVRIAG
jgi:Penicillin-insensitive murein endopeptidase